MQGIDNFEKKIDKIGIIELLNIMDADQTAPVVVV